MIVWRRHHYLASTPASVKNLLETDIINIFAWWKIKMLCIFKKFAYKIIVISLIKCVLFQSWKKEKSQLQLAYYSQALELVQIRFTRKIYFILYLFRTQY